MTKQASFFYMYDTSVYLIRLKAFAHVDMSLAKGNISRNVKRDASDRKFDEASVIKISRHVNLKCFYDKRYLLLWIKTYRKQDMFDL